MGVKAKPGYRLVIDADFFAAPDDARMWYWYLKNEWFVGTPPADIDQHDIVYSIKS